MTKNDLINEVAYELNDFLSKEQIDRMKITLYVKMQDFELAEIKQLPMTMEHDNEWLMQRYVWTAWQQDSMPELSGVILES